MTSDYKKYSLEKLQEWVHDAMNSDASPHEIYSAIREAVREDYYYHKDCISRASGLLELLSGHRPVKSDDVKEWDMWEEHYYPEEHKGSTVGNVDLKKEIDKIREEGGYDWTPSSKSEKSDHYYDYTRNDLTRNNPFETKNGVTYSEYTKAKIEANSAYNDGWTQEHYQKIVDKYEGKQPKKWVLPVEELRDENTGEDEYCISFPDDLLEAANLKEGDLIEWVDQGDGSYLLEKHVERYRF